MATINYATKEISCKIVYYGPGLGGKTTNLQYIHDTVPENNRGELVSLATQQDRTLFFDFLPMDIGSVKGFETKFHLYTVPGQVYYNATRKLVLRGVDGIVFVADSQRDRLEENVKSLQNLRDNLFEYNYDLDNIPWVIQYNKRDLDNISTVEEMETVLNSDHVPFYESVAITGKEVKQTLKAISSMVLQKLGTIAEKESELETPLVALAHPETREAPATTDTSDMLSDIDYPPARKRGVDLRKSESGSPEDLLTEALPISQQCDLVWQGLHIGSASVHLTRLENTNGRVKYRLTGEMKILAFFKRQLHRRLIYLGEKEELVESTYINFSLLTDPPETRLPLAEPFRVWVKREEEKSLYSSFEARYGRLYLAPRGKKPIKV